MSSANYPLLEQQLIVSVKIGVSAARAAQLNSKLELPPKPIIVQALIDTGATLTVFDATLVHRLRMTERGYCNIAGFASSETIRLPNYDISLAIQKPDDTSLHEWPVLQAVGSSFEGKPYQCLLGWDVLGSLNTEIFPGENRFHLAVIP